MKNMSFRFFFKLFFNPLTEATAKHIAKSQLPAATILKPFDVCAMSLFLNYPLPSVSTDGLISLLTMALATEIVAKA
jgi:hypothetical protein